LQKLGIRQRGPYHARHSSVTWQLMLGKNLLWVAKQHGHSVEVMLRMYAAWIEGATDTDIQTIKQAIEVGPTERTGIPLAKKIVINPLLSPEFGSSSASRKQRGGLSPESASEKSGGEGGIARGRGRPLVLRFAPDRRGRAATSKNRSAIFVEPGCVRPSIKN
jgi:hypothetical protein